MMSFNQIQHHWSRHERDVMAYWRIELSITAPSGGDVGHPADGISTPAEGTEGPEGTFVR